MLIHLPKWTPFMTLSVIAQLFSSRSTTILLLVATLAFHGCTTVPKDFSAHTDQQLNSEFQQLDQQILAMERQVQQLRGQLAYAATQEQSAAANFGLAFATARLNKLIVNRNSAVSEAQRRHASSPVIAPTQTDSPAPETIVSKPVAPTPPPNPAVTAAVPSVVDPQATTGHWVSEVLSNGYFVILEDDSVWEIDSMDSLDTGLWLPTEDVILIAQPYEGYIFHEIVNTDSGDKVSATFLGQVALRTNIKGEFNGWDGETVFVTDTENVFKQASYNYRYHYAYRPRILIIAGGAYLRLVVDGIEDSILVLRLR